jgi:hypothetical protein
VSAIRSFLLSEGGPQWDQLAWTITDAATGMTFEIESVLDNPRVYLLTVNGERELLERTPDHPEEGLIKGETASIIAADIDLGEAGL